MQRVILVLLLAVALSGCSDSEPADSGSSSSSTSSSTSSSAPEPVLMRETVLTESVAVSAGLDASGLVGCEDVSVGFTIGFTLGLSLTQGVDYDLFQTAPEHAGLEYNFTNQAATDVSLAWMSGNQVIELQRISGNEVYSGMVPQNVDGGLFAACDTAGASGKIEVYEWVEQ